MKFLEMIIMPGWNEMKWNNEFWLKWNENNEMPGWNKMTEIMKCLSEMKWNKSLAGMKWSNEMVVRNEMK